MDEFWVANAANIVIDRYIKYFEYDGNDEEYNEELRWDFIEGAMEVLEAITGRCASDELVY